MYTHNPHFRRKIPLAFQALYEDIKSIVIATLVIYGLCPAADVYRLKGEAIIEMFTI